MNLKNKIKSKIDNYLERIIKKVIREVLEEKKYNLKDGLQELAKEETCLWIKKNVPINLMFEDRISLLTESLKKIEIENGLVLEFGVYKGQTINYIAKNLNKSQTLYGFDSFEGLNEPWIYRGKGGFSNVNENELKVEDNVNLVKGFFDETLPDFVTKNPQPISFLHIDSDLYSSAKVIFDNLKSQIVKGTVIVFDEFFNYPNWKQGEFKAWNEFANKHSVEFEYIGFTYQRTKHKKSGNQLAIKILRK
jgi:predicted O-methyltransferase YrrM